jgi:DNA replication licensing factor MCM2
MLGSFIQSQKYSVHKTMERRFKRYLTFGSDYHQLLLSLLRGLLEEVQKETRQQGLMLQAEEQYRIPVR